MRKIVIITGRQGSGKSFTANAIRTMFFEDEIKDLNASLIDFTHHNLVVDGNIKLLILDECSIIDLMKYPIAKILKAHFPNAAIVFITQDEIVSRQNLEYTSIIRCKRQF